MRQSPQRSRRPRLTPGTAVPRSTPPRSTNGQPASRPSTSRTTRSGGRCSPQNACSLTSRRSSRQTHARAGDRGGTDRVRAGHGGEPASDRPLLPRPDPGRGPSSASRPSWRSGTSPSPRATVLSRAAFLVAQLDLARAADLVEEALRILDRLGDDATRTCGRTSCCSTPARSSGSSGNRRVR